MAKPTTDPRWDTTNNNSTDPGAGKRAAGYPDNSFLPADEYNYELQTQGDWLYFFDQKANASYDSLPEAIDNTDPGCCFSVIDDDPAYVEIEIERVARVGAPSAFGVLDTDGRYAIWVHSDAPAVLRVVDLTGATATTTITHASGAIASAAMDGTTIATLGGAGTLELWTYAGASVAVVGHAGTQIYDMARGYILTDDPAGAGTDFWIGTTAGGTVGTSAIVGSVAALSGRFSQIVSGSIPLPLVVWNNGANDLADLLSAALAQLWAAPITLLGASNPSLQRGLCEMAIFGNLARVIRNLGGPGGQDFVSTFTLDVAGGVAAFNTAITPAAASQVFPSVICPREILQFDAGTPWWYRGPVNGLQDATITPTLGLTPLAVAPDGRDLLFVANAAADDVLIRVPLGHHSAQLQRYAAAGWRPVCRSLGVMEPQA